MLARTALARTVVNSATRRAFSSHSSHGAADAHHEIPYGHNNIPFDSRSLLAPKTGAIWPFFVMGAPTIIMVAGWANGLLAQE